MTSGSAIHSINERLGPGWLVKSFVTLQFDDVVQLILAFRCLFDMLQCWLVKLLSLRTALCFIRSPL